MEVSRGSLPAAGLLSRAQSRAPAILDGCGTLPPSGGKLSPYFLRPLWGRRFTFQPGAGLAGDTGGPSALPALGEEKDTPPHRETDRLSKEQGARRASWRRQHLKTACRTAQFGAAEGRGRCSWERHPAAAEGACTRRPKSEPGMRPAVPQWAWTATHFFLQTSASSSVKWGDDSPPHLKQGCCGNRRAQAHVEGLEASPCWYYHSVPTLGRAGRRESYQPGGPCEGVGPGQPSPSGLLLCRPGLSARLPQQTALWSCHLVLGLKKAPSSVSPEKKTHGSTPSTKGGSLPPQRGGRALWGPPDLAPANHTSCFVAPGP